MDLESLAAALQKHFYVINVLKIRDAGNVISLQVTAKPGLPLPDFKKLLDEKIRSEELSGLVTVSHANFPISEIEIPTEKRSQVLDLQRRPKP